MSRLFQAVLLFALCLSACDRGRGERLLLSLELPSKGRLLILASQATVPESGLKLLVASAGTEVELDPEASSAHSGKYGVRSSEWLDLGQGGAIALIQVDLGLVGQQNQFEEAWCIVVHMPQKSPPTLVLSQTSVSEPYRAGNPVKAQGYRLRRISGGVEVFDADRGKVVCKLPREN